MAVAKPDQASPEPPGWATIEELFAALESPLLSYALRLLGQSSLAEDVVQEAFMRLHAHFAEVRQPKRWLYRTVHNLALNHQRVAGRIVPFNPAADGEPSVEHDTPDPKPLPDEQIIRLEGIGLVRLSLEALDERSRELIRLKFTEDLSYQEIAERMSLKSGHVGYLLHRAVKAIGAELAKSGAIP
jgi:RNA polymerase sigma-70 factor (ECF subfamily)